MMKAVWEAAKVECQLYDLLHAFGTKLAEAGVPESTMLDMMGHMSMAMLSGYSHIIAPALKCGSSRFPNGERIGERRISRNSLKGRVAQLVRAPASHAGGHRFESCRAHHNSH
jgi:hypothetical protein